MFSIEQKQEIIANIDLFRSISAEKQKVIAQRSGVKNFKKGDTIFQEESWGNEAFIICEGEVQIIKGNNCLATLREGDIFGEMAIISKERRSATARATQNLKVLFLKEKVLKSLIEEIPDVAFSLMNVLANRLRVKNGDKIDDTTDIYATTNIPNGIKCPNCFEWNKADTKVCQYCEHRLQKDVARFLVLSVVCLGIGVASILTYNNLLNNTKQTQKVAKVNVPLVSVQKIEPQNIKLRIEKYGRVRASKTVTLTSEIQGSVYKINPKLKKGHMVSRGQLLVEISQKEYENKIQNIKNEMRSIHLRLEELRQRKVSVAEQTKIVQQQKELVEKTLEKNTSLYGQQAVSESTILDIQKELLSFKKSIADLQSQEKQIPNQISVLSVELSNAKLQLNKAYQDIRKAKIRAPFRSRIREVHVEKDSLVSWQSPIVVLEDLDYVEIPTFIPLSQISDLIGNNISLQDLDKFAIQAQVSTTIGNIDRSWEGTVVRFEPLDEKNYTIPAIVRVKNTREGQLLQPGNFVKVVLEGRSVQKALVLPMTVLRENNTIHIVHEGQLQVRNVKVNPYKNRIIITEGVTAGEMVVLQPLPFIVSGSKLNVHVVKNAGDTDNESN